MGTEDDIGMSIVDIVPTRYRSRKRRSNPQLRSQEQSMTGLTMNRSVKPFVVMLICCVTMSAIALSQTKSSLPPVDKNFQNNKLPTFDVVSIRMSGKGETAGVKILPNGYQAKGMSIDNTILLAYFPAPYFKHHDELKGGPPWVHNELYDIEATISPSDLAEWQRLNQNMMQTPKVLQMMLRALLLDRFKLEIHSAPTEVGGYALVLNKHKLKLEKELADAPSTAPGMQLLDGGKAVSSMLDNRPVWTFSATSMAAFVGFLSFSAQNPLVDRTGLQGKYHFTVGASDPASTPSQQNEGAAADPDKVVPLDIEALGFKLDRIKVPTESWVIDRIQRPSSN
jgi:uncharacterized protein (TIGR03435 family)